MAVGIFDEVSSSEISRMFLSYTILENAAHQGINMGDIKS